MKILFVYSELVVEIVGNRYHHNFLNDILDRYTKYGELTVCTSAIEVESSKHREILNTQDFNFRFITKENTLKTRFFDRNRNKKALEQAVKESDYIFIHVPCTVQNIVANFAKKFNKPYMALVVGCPWDALWHHSLKGRLVAPLYYLSLKRFMSKTSTAMYVTRSFLQKRYPCKGLSIGCSDVELPANNRSVLTNRISKISNNNATHLSLATIGALIKVKGHIDVIKALSILKKDGYLFYYHIIGGGDKTFLENLAIKLDVADQVIFHGVLPHNKIFELLTDIDIYIQPSKTEGLCRALAEAMSMACPAIATNVGGNPELVNSKWLYQSGNSKMLATQIKGLSEKHNLLTAANENYTTAQSYQADLLNKRRNEFISSFIEENK